MNARQIYEMAYRQYRRASSVEELYRWVKKLQDMNYEVAEAACTSFFARYSELSGKPIRVNAFDNCYCFGLSALQDAEWRVSQNQWYYITIDSDGVVTITNDQERYNMAWLAVNETSLQDAIDISYAELVKVFGQPNVETDGYKVDAEWMISTPSGVATVYNYKTGHNYLGDEGNDVTDIRDWHIGGHDDSVTGWVCKALGISNPNEKPPIMRPLQSFGEYKAERAVRERMEADYEEGYRQHAPTEDEIDEALEQSMQAARATKGLLGIDNPRDEAAEAQRLTREAIARQHQELREKDQADLVNGLYEAQGLLFEAIELISDYCRETDDRNAEAYLLDQLKIMASEEHGFLSRDLNLDVLIRRAKGESEDD